MNSGVGLAGFGLAGFFPLFHPALDTSLLKGPSTFSMALPSQVKFLQTHLCKRSQRCAC